MLPVRLRPAAVLDLRDAWGWYELQRPGLGDEFGACIDAALGEIARDPRIWPRVHGDVRRHITRRFPYSVLFVVESEHIEVIAVFHSSRDPKTWLRRMP